MNTSANVLINFVARKNLLIVLLWLTVMVALFPMDRALANEISDNTLEQVKRSTVFVWTTGSRKEKGDTTYGTGTGYFINSTGLFVTNNHVIDPTHGQSLSEKLKLNSKLNILSYFIITDSGTKNERLHECKLITQSEPADQALLQAKVGDGKKQIDDSNLRTPSYLRFLPESKLKSSMKVWALGFPGGDSRRQSQDTHAVVTVTEGLVTDLPFTPAGRLPHIETDVIARPGNSGGPMVNRDGMLVGTVTLMVQSRKQSNTSALVPGALTRRFIRKAFAEGRVGNETDVTPFVSFLTDRSGRINVPTFKRLADMDTFFLSNGERLYGIMPQDKLTWTSPLGSFALPTASVAYILNDGGSTTIVLEGGNRIASVSMAEALSLKQDNAANIDRPLEELTVVACRTSGRNYKRPRGEVTVFDSDLGYLILTGVKGKAKIKTKSSTTDVVFDEIQRIDPGAGDVRIISLQDGRQLTGIFDDTVFQAIVAATKAPVEFSLRQVSHATIEKVPASRVGFGGLDLLGVLSSADKEIYELAMRLEAGEVEEVQAEVNSMLQSDKYSKARVAKEQIKLLDGVAAIRAGDIDALKKISKCLKAKDAHIASFARAYKEVLKRYKNTFNGAPLSDPDVFTDAGMALAEEVMDKAAVLLKNREQIHGHKNEYKLTTQINRMEKNMQVASVFAGTIADDVLLQLWLFGRQLSYSEWYRLQAEIAAIFGGKKTTPWFNKPKIDEIHRKQSKAKRCYDKYYGKLSECGFVTLDMIETSGD